MVYREEETCRIGMAFAIQHHAATLPDQASAGLRANAVGNADEARPHNRRLLVIDEHGAGRANFRLTGVGQLSRGYRYSLEARLKAVFANRKKAPRVLLAEAEFRDDRPVALNVNVVEVGKLPAALTNHLEQAAP